MGFELTMSMVIGSDCTGSCKSNYLMIMATTAPGKMRLFVSTVHFKYTQPQLNVI